MKKLVQSYRRSGLLCLAAGVAASLLATHVSVATPYASKVTKAGTTVNYVLNQDAQGVTILTNGVAMLSEVAPAKGAKSFELPTADTPFSIVVTGNTAKGWVQISDDAFVGSKYYSPRGVAIDSNPKRTTFGAIIVCEGLGGAVGAGGRTTTEGLFIMNADQSDTYGQGNTGYAGNAGFTTSGDSPYKIGLNRDDPTGQDYLVYIGDFVDSHSGVWTADLLNPGATFSELLDNTGRTSTGLVTNSAGQTVHGNIVNGPWVEGVGVDRKMYTLDEDYLTTVVQRYDIGTTTAGYNAAPTPMYTRLASVVGAFPMDAVRDEEGSWWVCQYRWTDSDSLPSLMRWTEGSTAPVWKSGPSTIPLNRAYGAVDIHTGLDLLAVGSSRSVFWIIDIKDPANPKLVREMPHTGATIRDVSFDAAGNLYVVSSSSETLRIYSPGGYTIATTTSDANFDLWTQPELTATAVDAIASEAGADTATFRIARTGGQQALTVAYELTGTATSNVDYTISPTSPVTLPANQAFVDVTVTPNEDGTREPGETVTLTLLPNEGSYGIASPNSATVTITDNDAVVRYWDIDGATAGAGGSGTPSGSWTDSFWSTSVDGTAATATWVAGALPVFSAGTDAVGGYQVDITGSQDVDSIMFEEGTVTLAGGTIALGNNEPTRIALGAGAIINSVIAGSGGLSVENDGNLELGGANTYTGTTTFSKGYIKTASSERIPDASTVDLRSGTTLDLSYIGSGGTETIGGLEGEAGTTVKLYPDVTLTVGGNGLDTTFRGKTPASLPDTDPNWGAGTITKVGAGTLSLGGDVADTLIINGGAVSINTATALGGGTRLITIDGGILRSTSSGQGDPFVPSGRPITIGANNGSISLDVTTAVLMGGANNIISGPGVLTKAGPGEFRTYDAQHSFSKLIVAGGLWTAGHSTNLPYAESFGAVPAVLTPDAITIYGGASIRKAGGQNLALSPNQGITLAGAGTKTIRSYPGYGYETNTATFEITAPITGAGPLQLGTSVDSTSILVLSGNSSYTDGTILSAGNVTVFARNTVGSAVGSGTFAVSAGTLGGDGIIGGPVVVTGGLLAPGYSYNTGPQPVVSVAQPIAALTMGNGLSISGATYNWQLGALSTANPGTDFDQVQLIAGDLSLGAGAQLSIAFTGAATAPSISEPFWQQARQWKVISLSGTAQNPLSSNFVGITGTNGITIGTFSTVADATGVTLVWTPSAVPVTGMAVAGVSEGSITINYTGGFGSQFVLLRTFDLTVPTVSWDRVATNAPGGSSFTIPVGTDPKAFYRIKSEF